MTGHDTGIGGHVGPEYPVIRRIGAGWSSCCGNPNLAGDGADEWAGSLCLAQGHSYLSYNTRIGIFSSNSSTSVTNQRAPCSPPIGPLRSGQKSSPVRVVWSPWSTVSSTALKLSTSKANPTVPRRPPNAQPTAGKNQKSNPTPDQLPQNRVLPHKFTRFLNPDNSLQSAAAICNAQALFHEHLALYRLARQQNFLPID